MPHGEMQRFFPKAELLTSQFQKAARHQAIHMVSSWVKSLYPNILKDKFVRAKILTDDQRRQLCTIGKYTLTTPKPEWERPIDAEMVDLYWWLVWEPDVTGRRPTPHDWTPMVLSEKVIRLEPAEESSAFGLWLSISTLESRERVLLPLAPHPKLPSRKNLAEDPEALEKLKLAKTIMLLWDVKGRLVCQLTDKSPQPEPICTEGKVAVDAGRNVLAATSDGRLFGREFKEKFDPLYYEICRRRRMRQQQGLPRDSMTLRLLEARLSGLVKTEVGRVANLLLRLYPGFVFVMETMDLRGTPGSKRFAYNLLYTLLARKAVVDLVHNAYNSQMCPRCLHVSRKNRDGVHFHCRNCGYKSHADLVGAGNALGRSGTNRIPLESSPEVVYAMLRAQYRTWRSGLSAAGRAPPGVPYVRTEGDSSPTGAAGRRKMTSGTGPLTVTDCGQPRESHSELKSAVA